MNFLKQDYNMSKDWAGNLYCGITFNWHYDVTQYLNTSMSHNVHNNSQSTNMPINQNIKIVPCNQPHDYIVQHHKNPYPSMINWENHNHPALFI